MNFVYSLVLSLSYFRGNLTKNSRKLTIVQWGLMLNNNILCMRGWEEHLKSMPFGLSSIGSFQGVLNPLSKLSDV